MENLYDHEVEKAALGIFANVSATDLNAALVKLDQSGLTQDCFHLPKNKVLFAVIDGLLRQRLAVDALSVKAELERTKGSSLCGWDYVCDVVMGQSHLHESSLPAYSNTLKDLHVRRLLVTELREAHASVIKLSNNASAVSTKLAGRLIELSANGNKAVRLTDISPKVLDQMEDVASGKTPPVIKTGFSQLDGVIGGLQKTLIMVGALPGVGKSAFLGTLASAVAKDHKVGILSLEDDPTWLVWRYIAKESGVNQYKLRFERLSEHQLERVGTGFESFYKYAQNIFVADGSEGGMDLDSVVQTATSMILNHGCEVIIVDHLGEIEMDHRVERQDLEIGKALSRLRGLANRYGVSMVVAAHLVRRESLGPGDEPRLSDFAGSAAVGRKARVALGLYREPDSESLNVSVLKNTNGKAGLKLEMKFIGPAALLDPNNVHERRTENNVPALRPVQTTVEDMRMRIWGEKE
jgi:replicative DNA helicase